MTTVIGITGSTGAGKSLLAERIVGAPVGHALAARRHCPWGINIEVDVIGHELLTRADIKANIVSAFGTTVLDSEGGIDRQQLGRLVFADPAQRHRLDGLMHPTMVTEVERQLNHQRQVGTLLAIVNAALLLRMQLDRLCDRIIQVRAAAEVRLERLTTLRGMKATDARTRLHAQDPDPDPSARVLTCNNDGSVADLDHWIAKILLPALSLT
jgi:dephospho-CoA kinase